MAASKQASTLTISAIAENRTVRLSDYKPHPRNYNKHPETQVQRIAKSLDTFGQVRSIVVWRDYVLAGHGVREAAIQLGWKELQADVLPDDYSEEKTLAYVVADNELSRLADPDLEQLVVILEELKQADPELVEAAGYDETELAALAGGFEPANDDEWADAFGKVPDEDRAPFQQITFTLHDSQAEQVKRAVAIGQKLGDFTDSPNQNSNGNGIAYICETFITEHGQS